jgi:uncharacterized membrane protein YkvA (DUF1232 family)
MTYQWIFVFAGIGLAVCVGIGALSVRAWRRTEPETKALVKRITRLKLGKKLRLAGALFKDKRLPLRARLIPPGLVLYLALPIDIIPDFIPVIGYLDDVIVMVVGVGLLLRLTPPHVLEEHLARLEADSGPKSG